jgi:hypothetical protein
MHVDILRLSDILLTVFWIWGLVESIRAGRIGGRNGFRSSKAERPGQYWFLIFVLALMVLHFGGLAAVGHKRACENFCVSAETAV